MSDEQSSSPAEVCIVGFGGFGREIAALLSDLPKVAIVGYFDDAGKSDLPLSLETPYLGATSEIVAGQSLLFGIGNPSVRQRLATEFGQRGATAAAAIVHPSAWVGPHVELGFGSVVCANASITTNIRLGQNVHVNINATIGHDSVIEDFVTLSPGVHLSGNVHLEQGVEVGTGAVVLPGVRVGAGAVVGGGSVVTKDVPANTTVVGIPAKPLG